MAGQVTVSVRQVSATTSEAKARQHQCFVDRPLAKGGADRGPMGGELMLAGIGGCFMSNLLAAARAREAAVEDLVVEVAATMGENPPRFTAIALTVTGGGDPALLRELVAVAERDCISANTVRGALALTVDTA